MDSLLIFLLVTIIPVILVVLLIKLMFHLRSAFMIGFGALAIGFLILRKTAFQESSIWIPFTGCFFALMALNEGENFWGVSLLSEGYFLNLVRIRTDYHLFSTDYTAEYELKHESFGMLNCLTHGLLYIAIGAGLSVFGEFVLAGYIIDYVIVGLLMVKATIEGIAESAKKFAFSTLGIGLVVLLFFSPFIFGSNAQAPSTSDSPLPAFKDVKFDLNWYRQGFIIYNSVKENGSTTNRTFYRNPGEEDAIDYDSSPITSKNCYIPYYKKPEYDAIFLPKIENDGSKDSNVWGRFDKNGDEYVYSSTIEDYDGSYTEGFYGYYLFQEVNAENYKTAKITRRTSSTKEQYDDVSIQTDKWNFNLYYLNNEYLNKKYLAAFQAVSKDKNTFVYVWKYDEHLRYHIDKEKCVDNVNPGNPFGVISNAPDDVPTSSSSSSTNKNPVTPSSLFSSMMEKSFYVEESLSTSSFEQLMRFSLVEPIENEGSYSFKRAISFEKNDSYSANPHYFEDHQDAYIDSEESLFKTGYVQVDNHYFDRVAYGGYNVIFSNGASLIKDSLQNDTYIYDDGVLRVVHDRDFIIEFYVEENPDSSHSLIGFKSISTYGTDTTNKSKLRGTYLPCDSKVVKILESD